MKTTFTHNHKYNFVELAQPMTVNVTYIHKVTYGYSYEGLQVVTTGISDGVWQISINSYAKTMGEALNKLQHERLKKVSNFLDMYQASTSLWK